MTPELKNYYENSFDLFLHPGWQALMEDAEELRKPVAELSTVPDAQTLFNRQGQLQIIDWLLNRKAMFDAAWKQLTEEDSDA